MRVGVEGRLRVPRVARPPAHGDLLGVHRVAHDEVVGRGIGRKAGEQAGRQVEGPPPGVDRCRPSTVRGTEGCEHQGGLGCRREVGLDLAGRVAGVLVVLVERNRPRHLLRSQIDLDRPPSSRTAPRTLRVNSATGRSGASAIAARPAVTVLDDRLVGPEIEHHGQSAGAIGCRQRGRLPTPRGETQRGMLELRFGRGQRHRQLPEDLGVRVQGVARLAPVLVGGGRPLEGHGPTLATPADSAGRFATVRGCCAGRSTCPRRWHRPPPRTSSIFSAPLSPPSP